VLIDLARTEELDNMVRVMGSTYVDEMVQDAARTIRGLLGAEPHRLPCCGHAIRVPRVPEGR
jgi:hypothetical protein